MMHAVRAAALLPALLPALAAASPQHMMGPGGPPSSAWSDIASEWQSWTAEASITAWPTASSEWASITSAHPLPSDLSSLVQSNGWAGGWPSYWTTNSGWSSAPWATGVITAGPAGWHGGNGPFGHGGPGGNGWGAGPWSSNGSWTTGPWTNWWGTSGCPPSSWTGWTNGPWGSSAPWTTWTACTAETTATSVYTTTVTETNGTIETTVGTSYGYGKVAEATQALTSTGGSTETSGSGAMPTKFAVAASAAGVFGVLAGAILL